MRPCRMVRATSPRFQTGRTPRTVSRRGRVDGASTVLVVLLAVAAAGCAGRWQNRERLGPPDRQLWATPVQCNGVPNLYRVDANLYRGAQPDDEGFQELAAMGIKTLVNLRTTGTDKGETADVGLAYERIWFRTWHPEDEDVVRFLRIATDPTNAPVFVHCKRGAERTGVMCAIYRVIVCRWTKDEAIREMTEGGFGFDRRWQRLVDYVRRLDVPKIKQAVALAE